MNLLSVTHFLNGFLMLAVPIILAIFLTNKLRLKWRYWWIGALTFITSQIFHLPFNAYLLNPSLARIQQSLPGVGGFMLISVLLGLSAGIFETAARYAMYRWFIKDHRSWRVGVLAGAGHGGVEAIILGGLVLLTYINLTAYRNLDLTTLNLSSEQLTLAQQQVQAYWSLPWYQTMLGALERMFTIPFHIAASVLVLQVFTRKPGSQQLGWLALVVLLHALMDASGVFVANQYSPDMALATFGILAVLDIIIIFLLRQPDPEASLPVIQTAPPDIPLFIPTPVEETSENLDNSRYQ